MNHRVISALVALCVLAMVLFCYNTVVFNAAIAIISVVAVFELLCATKYVTNRGMVAASLVYAAVVPFFGTVPMERFPSYVTLVYFVILFAILLTQHTKVMFEEVTTAFFVSLVVPVSFSILVYIRDHYEHGLFYTLLVCVAAWIADTAAYFVGRAFGKHKLCPLISPHKTVEGAIGGVFFAVLFFVLFCFGYSKLRSGVHISYLAATIDGAVCAVMGIVGDLMASVVKRQRGIKDFGHIMPGHGGVIDLFDSFLFVAPTLYLILQVLPIVTTLA